MQKKFSILLFLFLISNTVAVYAQKTTIEQLEKISKRAAANPKKAEKSLDSLNRTLKNTGNIEKAKINQVYGTLTYRKGNTKKAIGYLKEAANYYSLAGDSVLMSKAWNNIGVIYGTMAKFDTALFYYNKALQVREKHKNSILLGRTLMNIANIYNRQGLFSTATQYYYRALEIFEKNNYKKEEATTLANIGVCQNKRGHLVKADSNFQMAYRIFRSIKDTTGMLTALNNAGTIELDKEQYEAARNTFSQILKIAKTANDEISMAFAYNNLGQIAIHFKKREKAKTYLQYSDSLFRQHDYRSHLLELKSHYAELLFREGQRKEALKMMKTSYTRLMEIKEQPMAMEMGKRYAKYLQQAGEHKKAAALYHELGIIQDSIYTSQKNLIAEDLEAKYQFEKQKKELQFSRKKQEALVAEKKFQQERFRFYSVGLTALLLLLSGLIFFLFYRNRQKNKLISEKEKSGQLELEYSELKNKTLQQALSNKNKELSRFALHISEKNRFLQDISKNIKQAKSPEDMKEVYLRIIKNMQSDKESEAFYNEVNQFLSQFRTILENKYENLTEKDIRLCTLIRLDLSSKDIAAIFNISPKSVDMQRYRLRKKMDIPKNMPIEKWLDELENRKEN